MHVWINFPRLAGIHVSDDQFSSPHLDKSGCWGEQLYHLLSLQHGQASVLQLRAPGMLLPHWLLYFPWRRKGDALSRNAAERVACSLLCLFSLTRSIRWWLGRHEESAEEGAVAGQRSFTAAAPTLPVSSSNSTLNLWGGSSNPFCSVLGQEKDFLTGDSEHAWSVRTISDIFTVSAPVLYLVGWSCEHCAFLGFASGMHFIPEKHQKFWPSTGNLQIPPDLTTGMSETS